MADRMIECGVRPVLWARRAEILDPYRETEARIAASPAEIGATCDVIGLCLYDDAATDAVLFGPDGVMTTVRPGTVIAVHATVSPDYVIDLARRVAEAGVRIVDAPVSGGDAARTGELLVILGDEDGDGARCAPMFDAYASRVVRVGGLGAAQTAKLLNNALMAATTGLVFDMFELAGELGLDSSALGEVVANGSGACYSVNVYRAVGDARTLSVRAWPTLHKDVDLLGKITAGQPVAEPSLPAIAAATIRQMARRRTD